MSNDVLIFKNDLPDSFTLEGDIAIDTEAMGLNFYRDRLCTIQICDSIGVRSIIQFEIGQYNAPNLKKILEDADRVKIFHFARFDVGIIKYYLQIDIQNVFCTKVASKLVRTYTDMHGLKELCRELLGVHISKLQQSSDWGSAAISKEQIEYAISDVIYLHKLRDILTSMLIRENRLDIAHKLFKFLPTRCDLDILGWPGTDIFAY
jgi:ribonuclease D